MTVSVAAPAPDTVWVRVQDRGVGIPRKQLKRIFNRFYRVQARGIRQIKGTGLGLYIVRSIARAHGGRVFAQSEGEGRGSTFTLELPRLASAADAARPAVPVALEARRIMSRILIVEDEQHIADGLRFNLEAEGHEATVVPDGEARARDAAWRTAGRSTSSSSTSCCPARTDSRWPRSFAPSGSTFRF